MFLNSLGLKGNSLNFMMFNFHRNVFLSYFSPGGSVVKNMIVNAGDAGDMIPGLGRSPGGGNGNPLQNSCLENPMDRGA